MINGSIIRATWKAFNDDKAPRLAAAIAYSAIFSLAPLLILCIALGGILLGLQNGGHGHHIVEDALLNAVARHTGKASAAVLRDLIAASFKKPQENLLYQLAAWITFIIGAMGFFGTLQDALNSVWNIERINGGFRRVVHDRLTALAMLFVVSILILLSFGMTAIITVSGTSIITRIINQILLIVVIIVAFGLLFKFLPDVTLEWRDVTLGAVITAILFVVGELFLTKYLAVSGIASAYGAAGSLLVILIWIYYSAMILLFGAEFTKVTARNPRVAAPSTTLSFRETKVGEDPRFTSTYDEPAGSARQRNVSMFDPGKNR
jgi:membrane protein